MKLPKPFSSLVKALVFVCRLPGKLSRRLNEALEDWAEMAPYNIRLMSSSFSSSSTFTGFGSVKSPMDGKIPQIRYQDEFTRREMITWHFISYDRMLFGKHDPITARQWMNLADLYWEYRRPGDARAYYEKALKIFRMSCKSTDDRLIEVQKKLSNCYLTIGSYSEVEQLLNEVSVALDEKIRDASAHETTDSAKAKSIRESNVAGGSSLPKKSDKADAPRDHVRNLRAERVANLLVLAETLKRLKKFRQAVDALALVVDVFESDGQLPKGDDCLAVYCELSVVYSALGESTKADLYQATAKQLDFLRIMESAVGRESRSLIRELEPLAVLYQKREKFDIVNAIRKQIELCELASKVASPINYKGIEADLERLAKHYDERDDYGDATVAFHLRARVKRVLSEASKRISIWALLAVSKTSWLIQTIELNEAFYATILARLF